MASGVMDTLPFVNALGESLLSEAAAGKHMESKPQAARRLRLAKAHMPPVCPRRSGGLP